MLLEEKFWKTLIVPLNDGVLIKATQKEVEAFLSDSKNISLAHFS
jgi:hypothetical protein